MLDGSVLRIVLTARDLKQRQVHYSDEVRDALFPAFFEIQKRADRNPVRVQIGEAETTWGLEATHSGAWGTNATAEFWEWLKRAQPRARDSLLLTVVDGEARLYRVAFEAANQRDEPAIAARNRVLLDAALAYLKTRAFSGVAFWDLAAYLLNIGLYKAPVAPDPLETVWERALAEAGIKRYRSEWGFHRMESGEMQQLLHYRQENALAPDTPLLPANVVYQLKISLEGSRPLIWRRVRVPGEFTLADLHHVVQIVMGWESYHMHRFEFGGVNY
ncbi:MAG: plasmid pRiA4b ORF-3 family protein, partial [Anaerolineales bacterium]|nr:plasmid pRiA4b ORF-3 family protein [Anaerolineales bacterium]